MPVTPSTPESRQALKDHFGKGLIIFGARRPDRSTTPSPKERQDTPEDLSQSMNSKTQATPKD